MAPMGQQLGGEMFSPDGLEVKGYLDQEPWVDLATRWGRFFENDASAITTPEWSEDQFLAGEAAFDLDPYRQVQHL